jgi:hypothetical protein
LKEEFRRCRADNAQHFVFAVSPEERNGPIEAATRIDISHGKSVLAIGGAVFVLGINPIGPSNRTLATARWIDQDIPVLIRAYYPAKLPDQGGKIVRIVF